MLEFSSLQQCSAAEIQLVFKVILIFYYNQVLALHNYEPLIKFIFI